MKYMYIDERRLQLFNELIKKWDQVLKKFEKVMGHEDLPYAYGERPNIGFVAISAAKLGFITLEEYESQKKSKYGRADLWLYHQKSHISISIEAKITSLSWKSKIVASRIGKTLDSAIEDVKKVKEYEGATYSIGIAFLKPYNANPENFSPKIFWEQIKDRSMTGADFCAMHLCSRKIWTKQKYAKGFPGIVMAGRFL